MIAEPEAGVDADGHQVENVEGERQGEREHAVNGVVQNVVDDAADITEEDYEREDDALAAGALALERFDDGERPCDAEAHQHENFKNRCLDAENCDRRHDNNILSILSFLNYISTDVENKKEFFDKKT